MMNILFNHNIEKERVSVTWQHIKTWKTSYLDILNLTLFISCTFKVPIVVFVDVSEEFYTFAAIVNVIFSAALYILNIPCLFED